VYKWKCLAYRDLRRGFYKSGRHEIDIFPTDSSKFSRDEVMGAQNFNSVPIFSQNGDFVFWKKIFLQEKISDSQKI